MGMARTWRRVRLVQALRVSLREACSHVRLSNVVIPWESASVAHPSWALGFALKWPILTYQYGLNFKQKLQLSIYIILEFGGVIFAIRRRVKKKISVAFEAREVVISTHDGNQSLRLDQTRTIGVAKIASRSFGSCTGFPLA